MKKAKLELSEFMVLCRQAGYFDLNDIRTAVFEYNGRLTILPYSHIRPVTSQDLNITPKSDEINTEIIMDGNIIHENIKRLGLDLKWLYKELKKKNIDSAEHVYLGVCDSKNNLYVFKSD